MRIVDFEEYSEFLKRHEHVIIGGKRIALAGKKTVTQYRPVDDSALQRTTVWSFPERGNWATHRGDYPGNWSPYIPRNLLLKYTEVGDVVLDPMMGSGTSIVESRLLCRNAIGMDINYNAVMVAFDRLNFHYDGCKTPTEIHLYHGDARDLNMISSNSIDFILTHPPYGKIISYSKKGEVTGDLSTLPYRDYIEAMGKVAEEFFRVLKPGKYCALLIGDTRKNKHYVPIAYDILQVFLEGGFILKENIIKIQWNTTKTSRVWSKLENDFYLIAHENLFVFRKPVSESEYRKYKFSAGRRYGKI